MLVNSRINNYPAINTNNKTKQHAFKAFRFRREKPEIGLDTPLGPSDFDLYPPRKPSFLKTLRDKLPKISFKNPFKKTSTSEYKPDMPLGVNREDKDFWVG